MVIINFGGLHTHTGIAPTSGAGPEVNLSDFCRDI